jgi:flagellin-like protein
MKKGLTPVVASVLLMAVAVAATGTVFTLVQENIDEGKKNVGDISLEINALRIQQCYQINGDTLLDVRNTASNAINASKVTPLLNGSIENNYDIQKEIVDPQSIFTINLTGKQLGPETSIILTDGKNQIEHTCLN